MLLTRIIKNARVWHIMNAILKNVLYRMRSNYALSSPNNEIKEYYHDKIMEFIVNYPDIIEKLITSININDNEDQSYDVKCRVVSSILLVGIKKPNS